MKTNITGNRHIRIIKHITMAAALLTIVALQAKAQLITTPAQVIDCGQVLFRKPVTVHFELTNEGGGAAQIKKVETSCGCTNVEYPKGTISENKPFVVTATYDAKQMGHFEKYIDLYTNGATLPFTLTMKGVVVEEVKDFGGTYQYMIGRLKADKKEIWFDDVTKGDNPVAEIHVHNATGDQLTPVVMHLPDYLKVDISPSSIPPGKQAVIHVTLNSSMIKDYGLQQTSIYLGQRPGDKVSPDNEIDITAILLPYFGMVSEQQLVYMPKMKISETVLDLGEFEGKKKKKGTITIENLGRTDLEIQKMQMFTEGLTLDLSSTVIHPGEEAKLRITADKKMLKGVKKQPKVLLITNDPRMPKVIIDVNVL